MSNLPRIEKLQRSHNVGQDHLNRFLIRFASQNQPAGGGTTYVALTEQEILDFYALTYGHIEYGGRPKATDHASRPPSRSERVARALDCIDNMAAQGIRACSASTIFSL